MKDALSRALVTFYPLGGRFMKGEDGRIAIDCRGQGALFVEAESDGLIDDFGDFAPRLEYSKLVPVVDVDFSMGIESHPLLVLQVTHFKCGGVSLVAAVHHYVADGTSTIHFINTWSVIARGLDITSPPFIDRSLLRANDPPQPVFEHVEYYQEQTLSSLHRVPIHETKTVSSIFIVTQNQLDALKAKSKEDGNKTRYTTFEILAGHVWKCVCKSRGLPEDVDAKVHIATNRRARLQPPLPQGYFGNVIFTTISKVGEIQSKPIWYAASKIHDSLVAMKSDYLKSALNYMEQHLDQKPTVSYKYTNIRIVSWARLGIHEADFGWGRPFFMGPTRIVAGLCIFVPSLKDDGNIWTFIGLEGKQMKLFCKLFNGIKMFDSSL